MINTQVRASKRFLLELNEWLFWKKPLEWGVKCLQDHKKKPSCLNSITSINRQLIKLLSAGSAFTRGLSSTLLLIFWTYSLIFLKLSLFITLVYKIAQNISLYASLIMVMVSTSTSAKKMLSILLPGNSFTETMGSEQHYRTPGWHLCCPLLAWKCLDASPPLRCINDGGRCRRRRSKTTWCTTQQRLANDNNRNCQWRYLKHVFIIWQEADEDQSKPAWDLEAGMTLPFFYGDPPPSRRRTPLEELDPHFQTQKVDVD